MVRGSMPVRQRTSSSAFPQMVTYWLEKPVNLDPAALEKQFGTMPTFGTIELHALTPPKP